MKQIAGLTTNKLTSKKFAKIYVIVRKILLQLQTVSYMYDPDSRPKIWI